MIAVESRIRRPGIFWLKRLVPLQAVLLIGVIAAWTPSVWASNAISGAAQSSVTLVSHDGRAILDGSTVSQSGVLPVHVLAPGSTIVRVKYVLDGTYLGDVTVPPFDAPIIGMAIGAHKLRATIQLAASTSVLTTQFTLISGASSTAKPSPSPSPSTSSSPVSGGLNVAVRNALELKNALARARPGQTITLADGSYLGNSVKDATGTEPGRFVAAASGTASAPITLRGSRNAVIDGGGTGGGYGLHLKNASYWNLTGFTVSGASKGIVLDGSDHVTIDGIRVTNIGMEGVHFRSFSSDNILENSDVSSTGISSPNFGERVYVGSANSNWRTYTAGLPDRSDRNSVVNNTIVDTRAEDIDIKEGTTGGRVSGNLLGGDKMISGENSADSWIDIKGNGYLIDHNHGIHTSVTLNPSQYMACNAKPNPAYPNQKDAPFCNGVEIHTALAGWGQRNVLQDDVLAVNANTGNQVVGIWLQNTAVGVGNVIKCSNVVSGATAGSYAYNHFTRLACTP